MKILLMTPLWGQWGGKEQYVLKCIEEFTRMGHGCALIYSRDSSRPGQAILPSIRRYRMASYSDISSPEEAQDAEQLTGILRDEAPDVIFMCDVKNLRLLAVLKRYGGLVPMSHDNWLTCMRVTTTTYFRRSICTHQCGYRCLPHGCFLGRKPTGRGIVYNSLFQHRALLEAYKSMDVHLVNSNYLKERLVLHGFRRDQVRVVGYFTDVRCQTSATIEEDTPSVTYMGRVDRLKGVDYLLHALAQVSLPFRCHVIGEGPYLHKCKQLCDKLKLADRVHFAGWLSRDKLTERLCSSSMLVVPSIWPEPFGLVGLEAMMCSKPVVAFDVGGISDWLRDGVNGHLVPVKRADLLAQRIDVLLGDKQKAARMGVQGSEMVKALFSKEQHFQHLLSAFESAARRKLTVAI